MCNVGLNPPRQAQIVKLIAPPLGSSNGGAIVQDHRQRMVLGAQGPKVKRRVYPVFVECSNHILHSWMKLEVGSTMFIQCNLTEDVLEINLPVGQKTARKNQRPYKFIEQANRPTRYKLLGCVFTVDVRWDVETSLLQAVAGFDKRLLNEEKRGPHDGVGTRMKNFEQLY